MYRWITLLVLLLFATPALAADIIVPRVGGSEGCGLWTLCDGQTVSGICDSVGDTTGSTNVIQAVDEFTWTAFADTSSEKTGPWTIKIYSKSPGAGSGTFRTLLNETDMDQNNKMFSWAGLMGDIHAVTDGTEGTGVSLIIRGCPLSP